jgi:hypothetical protein
MYLLLEAFFEAAISEAGNYNELILCRKKVTMGLPFLWRSS